MRKVLLLLVALVALSLGVSAVAAQNVTPIEYGQTVEGEISNQQYEFVYSFKGNEGDLITIFMSRQDSDSSLDATLILRNPDGDPIATNDDFSGFFGSSLIAIELPETGEYSVIATRYGGSTGSSEGGFALTLDLIESVQPGDAVEATLYEDYDKRVPTVAYYVPEEDGPVTFNLSQEVGEIYASLRISETPDWGDSFGSSYYTTVLEVSNTARMSSGSFTLDLQAGRVYVLSIDTAFGSFSFDVDEATATVTIG